MKIKHLIASVVVLLITVSLTYGQQNYNDILNHNYNPNIPTFKDSFGFNIGERHIRYDQLLSYMKKLAQISNKAQFHEYAHTYENRPLSILIITSEENHNKLDEIKQNRKRWIYDNKSNIKNDNMPIVIYMGYSIHGDEISGSNAAPLVAYHLVASEEEMIKDYLDNMIIIIDPSMNPDGMSRFTQWVTMYRSKSTVTDPQTREFNQNWPRGRTNHYWFDLNRDWLLTQHPESKGRIKLFHEWKPNVLTDHHEMGSNATYFFQPGVPDRTHPITPTQNQVLTKEIAKYHISALDKEKQLYYSREQFDDFYYGKGSTYPDVNGAIGILFEQASSRGYLRETQHGLLPFSKTIKNQIITSFSTIEGSYKLRKDLLEYQRKFFKTALEEAKRDNIKGYVVGNNTDITSVNALLDLLMRHDIEVHDVKNTLTKGGIKYIPNTSFIVPTYQPQYRLVKSIFERRTSFKSNIFYDVSAWNLADAFGLSMETLDRRQLNNHQGQQVNSGKKGSSIIGYGDYAYVFSWGLYDSPKVLYYLLNHHVRVKVSNNPFKITINGEIKEMPRGSIIIPMGIQDVNKDVKQVINNAIKETNVNVYALSSGYIGDEYSDFGSNNFDVITKPKVALIIGNGVNAYEAGEVWHLLDRRYNMPLVMLDVYSIRYVDLEKYNTLVLVDGSYNAIDENRITRWVNNGGTLILTKRAVQWAINKKMVNLEIKKRKMDNDDKEKEQKPYDQLSNNYGAHVIGGAIFSASLDITHPIGYGYNKTKMAVFKNNNFFVDLTKNSYATPLVYTNKPLLAGYISKENEEELSASAAITVHRKGQGKIICMLDNPNFRAFWYGTNKLFANTIFFSQIISSGSLEN